MKLQEQIYQAAQPLLEGRTVTDLVIGISMLAVELDGKEIAVSYVLRDSLKGGCSVFSYASEAVGMSALEVGKWFVTGGDDLQRSIGGAVINAAARVLPLEDTCRPGRPFDVEIHPGDRVGMIGNIRPVAMQLKNRGCELLIFDKGQCAHGNPADQIYPMERQAELLPTCDVVFMSGTTMINGTAGDIVSLSTGARDVVMVGASTPMVPAGYPGTGVTVAAGSWWNREDKEDLFRLISRGAGMQGIGKYAIKKNVRV